MTDGPLATYTYLPWLRRGAAASISRPDPLDADPDSHVSMPVELTVNGHPVKVRTQLYGPGDVTGLDARQIVRMTPAPGSVDVPPNYLAAVDLAQEDLPWLFTPLRADDRDRLRPWITLIVVRRQPGVRLVRRPLAPLPTLVIEDEAVAANPLPDLTESWAWAHVQVAGTPEPGQTVEDHLAANPHLGVARIVCPQRLLPNSDYMACLVPAFAAGVDAGLGLPDPAADLMPAWDATQGAQPVQLPVYHHWEFGTGDRGDFESLARALRPRRMGPDIGQRAMDVGQPGPGMPTIPAGTTGRLLALEGALRSPAAETKPWPDEVRIPFEERTRELLDGPGSDTFDPVIGPILSPPLYARWHAAEERVPEDRPTWLRQLNLDPRYRSTAGFGTEVVKQDQEALMEEAWAQVGEIRRVNDELRRAQLARAVSTAMKRKHLDPLPPGELAQITRPLHRRMTLSPRTLYAETQRTRLAGPALSGAFRRFARPTGALAKRQDRRQLTAIVRRLNDADITPAAPRSIPDGTLLVDPVVGLVDAPPTSRSGRRWIASRADDSGGDGDAHTDPTVPRLTSRTVLDAPPRPDFRLVDRPDEFAEGPAGGKTGPSTGTTGTDPPAAMVDSEEARAFRTAAAAALDHSQVVLAPRVEPPPRLDIDAVERRLSELLDPELTIVSRVHDRLDLPTGFWEPPDRLEPVMAYPEFRRPMYEALAALSESHVIPGLERIPTDTVTLLETNPPVIQSFMAGLNHEMARELLWREFLTDQRGSYFRQFWDPSGRVPPPQTDADHEALLDIPPLHRWADDDAIGDAMTGGADLHQLVLVVRGELLRRFPNSMIFAERAHSHPLRGRLEPEGTVRWPLFQGEIAPDVHFAGFDLTEEEARGDSPGDHGWYLVIQEQPTDARFGLDVAVEYADTVDPVVGWDDLTWGHLAAEADFDRLRFIPVEGDLPDTSQVTDAGGRWGSNAADMAHILLQKPTRIAVHARVMLPKHEEEDHG